MNKSKKLKSLTKKWHKLDKKKKWLISGLTAVTLSGVVYGGYKSFFSPIKINQLWFPPNTNGLTGLQTKLITKCNSRTTFLYANREPETHFPKKPFLFIWEYDYSHVQYWPNPVYKCIDGYVCKNIIDKHKGITAKCSFVGNESPEVKKDYKKPTPTKTPSGGGGNQPKILPM